MIAFYGRSLVAHLVACCVALWAAFRYGFALGIPFGKVLRFWRKAVSLGLCYVGLCSRMNVRQAARAGEAGFLCAAYDAVTDWSDFEPMGRRRFRRILGKYVGPELQTLTMALYKKDELGVLDMDGLERGPLALELVTKHIGSWGYYGQRSSVVQLGTVLQVCDDMMDYESDMLADDMNCLRSCTRKHYLRLFLRGVSEIEENRLFSTCSILWWVLCVARSRAEHLSRAIEGEQWQDNRIPRPM